MSPSAITSSLTEKQSTVNLASIPDASIKAITPQASWNPSKRKLEYVTCLQGGTPENISSQQDASIPSQNQYFPIYPRLACQVNLHQDRLIFTQDGRELVFQMAPESAIAVQTLCTLMNGHHTISQLQQLCAPEHPATVSTLAETLAQHGFIAMESPQSSQAEGTVSSILHGVMNRWLHEGLSQQALKTKDLWQRNPQGLVPGSFDQEHDQEHSLLRSILTLELLNGWGMESYHLFSQLQRSCSSLLSYTGSRQTQALFKALYATLQDYVQHLLVVLDANGVGEEWLDRTLPLSSTMTVVNGLTFWANTEPLFCFSCLSFALDRMVANLEDYVAALDHVRLAPQPPNALYLDSWRTNEPLVAAMRSLIHNQRSHSPLSLAQKLFENIYADHHVKVRMYNQSHLFADMLCHFYVGIDRQYGAKNTPNNDLNSGLNQDAYGCERQALSILRTPGQKLGFKDGVSLTFKASKIELRYQNQGFAIAVSDDGQPSLGYALQLLQMGGVSPEQMAHACPDLQEHLSDILAECDRHDLLQKRQSLAERFSVHKGCSGAQFYQELLRFLTWLKQQFPPSPLSQHMIDGTISRTQLIGYALESYHVTALCPRLLAPILAQPESPQTQSLLRDFFVSELHHDRLMEKSLRSVGIPSLHLQHLQPLPTTFSVCSALGIFARQHPLSFKAALMLFEEDDPHFHELFEYCCKSLELPSEFYQPILLHARINDEGEHDQITADLLAEIPYITAADQLLVKKNMALLMEAMVLRTQDILRYYGHPNSVFPRIFSV